MNWEFTSITSFVTSALQSINRKIKSERKNYETDHTLTPTLTLIFVDPLGLEPRTTGPKPAVLPLHHGSGAKVEIDFFLQNIFT